MLDFLFGDRRTAVARWVEARQDVGQPVPVRYVGASFQEAVADVLTRKAVQACWQHGVTDLLIGGGAAANSRTSRSIGQPDMRGRPASPVPGSCKCHRLVSERTALLLGRPVAVA